MSKSRRGEPYEGPFEEIQWPERLQGHVATLGPGARIHGYHAEEDLARHYSFTDCALLSLTGELPQAPLRAAAEAALAFLAPAPVSEAPSHAALVARLCGASSSALVSVGAVTLAEQARQMVEQHELLLAWLARPTGAALPACAAARGDDDREAVALLRQALEARGADPLLVPQGEPSREGALLAVLFGCGLRTAEQLVTFMVMARLPCVVAEATAYAHRQFADYPMDLPDFRFEDDHE